jgi:hypothetical protein
MRAVSNVDPTCTIISAREPNRRVLRPTLGALDWQIMKLPHEYPYNPRVRLILLVAGVGLLWIGIQRLSWGRMPTGFSLWFGLVPIFLAILLGIRGVSSDRRLVLDEDEILLPTGFLQRGTERIAYSNIQRVWRQYLPATVVLRVATEERTFEIASVLLPDNESYRALETFLIQKTRENAVKKRSDNTQLA